MSALQLGQPRYRPYPASIVGREMALPSWSIDTPSRKSSLSLQRLSVFLQMLSTIIL